MGNDGYHRDTEPYCSQTVTKTCVLQCDDPAQELNADDCECVQKPDLPDVPEPEVINDCDDTAQAQDITEDDTGTGTGTDTDTEAPNAKDYMLVFKTTLAIVLVLTLSILIFIRNRKPNSNKKRKKR